MTVALRRKITWQISLGVLFGSLAITIYALSLHNMSDRKVFYFCSYDSKSECAEIRYFSRDTDLDPVRRFAEDLLLGPMTNRYKPIFPRGTSLEFCVKRGGCLYIGLSADAIKSAREGSDIRGSVVLFRKNLADNFSGFKKIYIYIDGRMVFGEG